MGKLADKIGKEAIAYRERNTQVGARAEFSICYDIEKLGLHGAAAQSVSDSALLVVIEHEMPDQAAAYYARTTPVKTIRISAARDQHGHIQVEWR